MKPLLIYCMVLTCAAALLSLTSCANPRDVAWTSPANAESLARLEAKTLETGVSPERRAQLFFLWGQELAAQSRQPAKDADPRELRSRAIGAFAKVIDLNAGLVPESRINLEILLRDQNQQDSEDKQDSEKSQDRQDAQDQEGRDQKGQQEQKDAQPNPGGQENPQDGKPGEQRSAGDPGDQDAAPRDLSGLVREKAGDDNLEQALKQENDRKAQEQVIQRGTMVPVEKDW